MKSKNAVFRKLAALYRDMDAAYEQVADAVGLSCAGCQDNCCLSFFQHHTHVEWAYLWHGLTAMDPEQVRIFRERAEEWMGAARLAAASGTRPRAMCPLNEGGLCQVYGHRMMICRLHGVPNRMSRPDGRAVAFPGCDPCQELTRKLGQEAEDAPFVDRTPLYRRLAGLEMELLGKRPGGIPRVDLTLAEMILMGPPTL